MLLLLLLLQSLLSAALLSFCAFFSIPCYCCHCCSFLPSFCLPFRLIHFHTYFAVVSPLFFSCPPFVAFLFGDQNLPELLLPLSTKKQPVERKKELIHHGKSICHLQQLFFKSSPRPAEVQEVVVVVLYDNFTTTTSTEIHPQGKQCKHTLRRQQLLCCTFAFSSALRNLIRGQSSLYNWQSN